MAATQTAHVADFSLSHRSLYVLFVGEYQQRCAGQSLWAGQITQSHDKTDNTDVLHEQTVQLFFTVFHSHAVPRINNPDKRVRLFEVISPVRTQRPLSADIP